MISMTEKDLWKYFWDNKIEHSRLFDRYLLAISVEDFEKVKKHFNKEINIFHDGESYRSNGNLFHIHVIVVDGKVFVHRDCGNKTKFLPLGIIHFFVDFVPYLVISVYSGKSINDIFKIQK